MKICVAGGTNEADFLIGILRKKRHKLAVINEDSSLCKKLSSKYGVPVFCGDPAKSFMLEDAGIRDYDIIIALTGSDADNLYIGQTAKKQFNVKKAVCIVSNPKNVGIFKQLGINNAISAAYMLADTLEKASTFEDEVHSLTVEEKIVLTEIKVEPDFEAAGKHIIDIAFPEDVIVSCILRGDDLVVPRGHTQIEAGDKLVFLSAPDAQKKIIALITKERADG